MKVFLIIILLAIFTVEFFNFCTNAMIWSSIDRKGKEHEEKNDEKWTDNNRVSKWHYKRA